MKILSSLAIVMALSAMKNETILMANPIFDSPPTTMLPAVSSVKQAKFDPGVIMTLSGDFINTSLTPVQLNITSAFFFDVGSSFLSDPWQQHRGAEGSDVNRNQVMVHMDSFFYTTPILNCVVNSTHELNGIFVPAVFHISEVVKFDNTQYFCSCSAILASYVLNNRIFPIATRREVQTLEPSSLAVLGIGLLTAFSMIQRRKLAPSGSFQ